MGEPPPDFQSERKDKNLCILHLSDLHIVNINEARKYRSQLEADLKMELGVSKLDYLVISGDISSSSKMNEYEAAVKLIDGLIKEFKLNYNRVIAVPGNHDLNWDISKKSYIFKYKSDLPDKVPEEEKGKYIPAGDTGSLERNDDRYRERFTYFSDYFYKKVCDGPYPVDYAEQGLLCIEIQTITLYS